MEVGLAIASFLVSSPLMRKQQARRSARASYRPSIALAGAQAPCKSVFLKVHWRLPARKNTAIVSPQSSVSGLAAVPNITFKPLTSFAWAGKSCAFTCRLIQR